MVWKRARTKDQKDQRVTEILSAASRLFEKKDFDAITFSMIAKEADFTRSNLYKYFSFKEDIFLEFVKQDVTNWRIDLMNAFDSYENISINCFARIWTDTLIKHKRLNRLIPILYNNIEKNSSYENLLQFKERFRVELSILTEKIISLFPMLNDEKVMEFLRLQIAISIGLFSMTNISEVQKNMLDKPEYSFMKVEIQKHMKMAIEHLITGVIVSY